MAVAIFGKQRQSDANSSTVVRMAVFSGSARTLLIVAGLILVSVSAAQETYSQQYNASSQRRAESSMVQFQTRLSKEKLSGDRSKSRILLSFSSWVPAAGIISDMDRLGIEVEDLQVSVGEQVNSFDIQLEDHHKVEVSVEQQLERSIAQREREIKWMLANESDERARYWLKEDLRLVEAHKARIAESPGLLISGVGCVASNDQIESLMNASPSLIRAIEFPGRLRVMSIPVEVERGPEEG